MVSNGLFLGIKRIIEHIKIGNYWTVFWSFYHLNRFYCFGLKDYLKRFLVFDTMFMFMLCEHMKENPILFYFKAEYATQTISGRFLLSCAFLFLAIWRQWTKSGRICLSIMTLSSHQKPLRRKWKPIKKKNQKNKIKLLTRSIGAVVGHYFSIVCYSNKFVRALWKQMNMVSVA